MEGGRGRALGAAPSTVFTRGEMRGAMGTVTRSDDSHRGTRAAAAAVFYDVWESQAQGLVPLPQLVVPENSTESHHGELPLHRTAPSPYTGVYVYIDAYPIHLFIYNYNIYTVCTHTDLQPIWKQSLDQGADALVVARFLTSRLQREPGSSSPPLKSPPRSRLDPGTASAGGETPVKCRGSLPRGKREVCVRGRATISLGFIWGVSGICRGRS